MLTADLYSDDRRPVVDGGVRPGRDAFIEDMRAVTEVELTNATSDAIATRGGRLALARPRYSTRPWGPTRSTSTSYSSSRSTPKIGSQRCIAFDANDIDAAIAELDARYLAGEAAAYAHTWSVITGLNAAINRQEIPPNGLGHHRPPATHNGRHE